MSQSKRVENSAEWYWEADYEKCKNSSLDLETGR